MNKAFEVYACEKMMPERVFKVEQTLTRKYDIEETLYFRVNEEGLPVTTDGSTADVDKTPTGKKPPLNDDYIIHNEDGNWQFDVMKLFLAAFQGENELQGIELRERVMNLSGIVIPFKYNHLLRQALEQKVIEKSQRNGLSVYRPAPF